MSSAPPGLFFLLLPMADLAVVKGGCQVAVAVVGGFICWVEKVDRAADGRSVELLLRCCW